MVNKLQSYIASSTVPYRNIATEYYFLRNVDKNTLIFYLWQNRHTVVIGKHQNPFRECKVNKLLQEGGFLARRISGGGAVYHDLGNLNFTFVTHRTHFDIAKQTEVICLALRKLGVAAEATGRNDIVVNGRKISGNAYYQTQENCYHHGTILINADIEKMVNMLTVDVDKMLSHSVASVKSRVVNLKECLPKITQDDIVRVLMDSCEEVFGHTFSNFVLDEVAYAEIEKLEKQFAERDFLFGKQTSFAHTKKQRFDWGSVEIEYTVKNGYIDDLVIYSDTLDNFQIPQLVAQLKGLSLSEIHKIITQEPISKDILLLMSSSV